MKHRIKKFFVLLLAVTLLCSLPAGAFAEEVTTVPVTVQVERYDGAAQEVLNLVNAERATCGLEPLMLDADLQEAAMVRAEESTVYFAHTRPDGSACWTVAEESVAGENLAVGQTSPQMVVEAWMNSPLHRANILHEGYRSLGIGCVKYNGIFFWSQAFGAEDGEGEVPGGITETTAEINLMTGLLEMKWAGETRFDMAETDAAEIKISGVNSGWEYMTFPLNLDLFTLQSSDESVVTVSEDGVLTPVSVGTAQITAVLKADTSCTLTQEIQIVRTLKAKDVKLSKTSYIYNGKYRKPAVTIEGLDADDYVVSYKNNRKVGTATVTITGVGDAIGTVKKTFKINYDRPDQVQLKAPTTGKTHYVKARWYDEDCDGYQIRYATNSSFTNSKSIYVKDGDQLTRTIKNLKKGTRYYIKVRAYNNYEDTKVYGKWSKWRSVVCK